MGLHRCTEPECPYLGHTTSRTCGCHKTDEQVLTGLMEQAKQEILRLRAALDPFVISYNKGADPIADSDLDNEQPRQVSVTLGDLRRAARLIGR